MIFLTSRNKVSLDNILPQKKEIINLFLKKLNPALSPNAGPQTSDSN